MILSPVVEFEVRRGLSHLKLTNTEKQFDVAMTRFKYSPFVRDTWLRAAELWAHTRRSGRVVSDADILIAAQAIELEAVLVTDNEKHFEVFKPFGLIVENWKQDVPNG
jgi:tRNA(fMet)-specific endonuclease VapC